MHMQVTHLSDALIQAQLPQARHSTEHAGCPLHQNEVMLHSFTHAGMPHLCAHNRHFPMFSLDGVDVFCHHCFSIYQEVGN